MAEPYLFLRLIAPAGAGGDTALEALAEVVAAAGVEGMTVDQRAPYRKGGLDREVVEVSIRGDRDTVIDLYDSLRGAAGLGWTDINDVERNAVWNQGRDDEGFLATVAWAEMAAIGEDDGHLPQ